MNPPFDLPMPFCLVMLFLLGAAIGTQLNRGIYRLAWYARDIGPWSTPHPDAPPRHWFDSIPIIGWWGLRRESSIHGAKYWIRPMLIELGFGFLAAYLYAWEMNGGLYPRGITPVPSDVHAQYFAHIVLTAFMVVASFIDVDEKTIPDEVTVPGALVGLLIAGAIPQSLLPTSFPTLVQGQRIFAIEPLSVTSPRALPDNLSGLAGLLIAIACFGAWCYAILPRTWWTRSGWIKALRYLAASILRARYSKYVLMLFLVGSAGILVVWFLGGQRWTSLLSSVIGCVFGGGIVWGVRVVASAALRREAMGFGDVTLMAMIGAFVGWQPSLIIFFLAPFAGLVVGSIQWLFTRQNDICYGPFLCLATLVLLFRWSTIWHDWAEGLFALGWLVPVFAVIFPFMMVIMLFTWRMIAALIFSRAQ